MRGSRKRLSLSLAENKKHEAGMKTLHTEIMNTLVDLCSPSTRAQISVRTYDGKGDQALRRSHGLPKYAPRLFQVVVDARDADSHI